MSNSSEDEWFSRDIYIVKHKTIKHAEELVILIDEMIPKRTNTINVIKDIAAKLTAVNKGVNRARIFGCVSIIVGWIAGTSGIIATGGLLFPLITFGGITAMSGINTYNKAGYGGYMLSKDKLTEAQNALDEDKEISVKIDKKKTQLDELVDKLGESLKRKRDEVFAEVMLESLLKEKYIKYTLLKRGIFVSSNILSKLAPKVYSVCNAAKMASILENVGVEGLASMVGPMFSIAPGVTFVTLNVGVIVHTSDQLQKGSAKEAADDLILFADKLVEGRNNLETMTNEFRDVAKKFQAGMVKEQIRKQLLEINHFTPAEGNTLLSKIEELANPGWIEVVKKMHHEPYSSSLAKIFRNFEKIITDYKAKEDEKENPRKRLPITMIGHGRIDKYRYPCSLYYMTESIKTVTLYQPWGCAIDVSGVYAIAVNNLQLPNVEYDGDVFPSSGNQYEATRPDCWNILPNDNSTIPTPIFTPISPDERAFNGLRMLVESMPFQPDGIVIPYLKGAEEVDLPEAPLYLIANALAFTASLSDIEIDFRYAACLTDPYSHYPLLEDQVEIITDSIYYSVNLNNNPPICMRNPLTGIPNEREIHQWIENNRNAITFCGYQI